MNRIQNIYYKTVFGKQIQSALRFLKYRFVPKKIILRKRFKKKHNYELNLKSPRTLNEKIVWLKLNDKTPLHTQCADKFEVRNYVSEKIGSKYLVPLYFATSNPNDLIPSILPQKPFIIKTNHDSSGGIFVYDKARVNWNQLRGILRKRMRKNYYWKKKEWQYKHIKPRIIVEKLLQDKDGKIPSDFKLHCFNGKVRTIQVDIGRGSNSHFRNWYSVNWEREPFKWTAPLGNNKYTEPSSEEVEKPSTLSKMIELSEILAKPFALARIDWYDVDGTLYFGEITFHHDSGNRPIEPFVWDQKLGSELKLPIS